jgi:diguanylate cyclase (GGDEF)-like protein/PAS domain S-box-containing protein
VSEAGVSSEVRTIVVDDVEEVRVGLSRLLGRIPGVEIVGTASDGDEAVDVVEQVRPQVVLMDMRMPRMDGIAATRVLHERFPDVAVILLTAYGDESLVVEALVAGARGYLLKGTSALEVAEAVTAVAAGESRLAGTVTKPLMERMVDALRVQADEQRISRAREEENRSLGERLHALVEVAPLGVIEVAADGTVRSWNAAATRMFQWSAADVVGGPDPILGPGRIVELVEKLAVPDAGWASFDAQAIIRDGSRIALDVSACPLHADDGSLTGLLLVVADVGDRQVTEARLRHQAYHDPLTALPNRTYFMEQVKSLAHAQPRATSHMLVAFIDLDNFKAVNDTLGHLAGDEVLTAVGARLTSVVPDSVMVARVGGDEFGLAAALPVFTDDGVIGGDDLVTLILSAFDDAIPVQGHQLRIVASVGVAEDAGHNITELLRAADEALYWSKDSGGNTHRRFSPDVHVDRMHRHRDLSVSDSSDRDILAVEYFPIVSLGTGVIVGGEVLVRWRYVSDGLLPPGPLATAAAHDPGLTTLTELVLERVASQASRWSMRLGAAAPYVVLSVAASQLGDPQFVTRIREAVAGAAVPAGQIVLDVVGDVGQVEFTALGPALGDLGGAGLGLSVTVTGGGWPPDGVPLSLVRFDASGPVATEPAQLTALLTKARSRGAHVIADGIDSERILSAVRQSGVSHGTGPLLGRPVQAAGLEHLLGRPSTVD